MRCKNREKEDEVKVSDKQKSRLIAFLLALFLGAFGAHNFYLGFKRKATIQIILSLFAIGWSAIWGLIEGILILTKRINKDSKENPLKI